MEAPPRIGGAEPDEEHELTGPVERMPSTLINASTPCLSDSRLLDVWALGDPTRSRDGPKLTGEQHPPEQSLTPATKTLTIFGEGH